VGEHGGLILYTIGQHRGLGLSLPEKKYVCALCPENNTVVLGDAEELYRRRKPLYEKFADAMIDNDRTVEDAVRQILEVLG